MTNELSIIVPCAGETDAILTCVDGLAAYLMVNPSDTDVIVVVANDTDERLDRILRDVRERYPWMQFTLLQRVGAARRFGALARFGIAFSTSRYVAIVSPFGDDDLAVLPKMLAAARSGAQVVQATRYATPRDAQGVPMRFRAYQSIYRAFVRFFLGHEVTDSTYGYKMFDRVFVQALGLTQNGYSICPEITLKGILVGGRVAYVPTTVQDRPAASDFRLLRDGPAYAWVLARGTAHRMGVPWF